MRFMMFIYSDTQDDSAWQPSADDVAAMTRYNEELTKAGALLALDGLHPTSKGARVRFAGSKSTVTDGPFSEAKEVVGGFWIIQAKSKDEAVEWARRCPVGEGDALIEVRQVFEISEFPDDVRAAGELSQEPPEQTSA